MGGIRWYDRVRLTQGIGECDCACDDAEWDVLTGTAFTLTSAPQHLNSLRSTRSRACLMLLRLHLREHSMRVDDVLRRLARVEVLVCLLCLRERDDLDVEQLREVDAVVEDRLQQVQVVRHHGTLALPDRLALVPGQAVLQVEDALLVVAVDAGRILNIAAAETDCAKSLQRGRGQSDPENKRQHLLKAAHAG